MARRLRCLRTLRGWAQEPLAEQAGLHRTYISGIERAAALAHLGNCSLRCSTPAIPGGRLRCAALVLRARQNATSAWDNLDKLAQALGITVFYTMLAAIVRTNVVSFFLSFVPLTWHYVLLQIKPESIHTERAR